MSTNIYLHPIVVKEVHIDEMNHVNNVTYLQWVQDAAAAHWTSQVSPEIRNQFKWVVLKHEIEYKSPAFLNEELIAKTWVHNYDGAKSTRIVQIIRKDDAKLLAQAKTLWCLLNAFTNRPTRVIDEIKNIFAPEKFS